MKKRKVLRNQKGQAAFEYMLIAVVIGIMILPAAYMFYRYSSSSAEQIDKAQLDKLGREIVTTAEKVYYQGPPSRTELEARMPKGILNLSIIGNWGTGTQQLMIKAITEQAITDFPYPSKVNINGSFNGSLNELTIGAGIKKVSIEAYETLADPNGQTTIFVHINFGGRCPTSVVYDFNTNGVYEPAIDGMFFASCCVNAAGFPKFRPSKTWQRGWFDGTGYAGGNPYAACMNADYDGDCDVDDSDRAQFCTTTGLLCAPIAGC
ncbi:hypothetical protein HYV85_02915 [Candidatus Woesearchaeota archaeon]|nr:hypothetical protein [Candidatus Woesearchaeota archaeon]